MTRTRAVEIGQPSGAAEARRVAASLAAEAGFGPQDIARMALVVTELSTNTEKHARSGWTLLTAGHRRGVPFLQAVAIDRGPGFDVAACLRDGHSTAGTAGGGLGAIARLSDTFDAYSVRQTGSVVFAEFAPHARGAGDRPPLLLAGLSVPKEGESECGDAWASRCGESHELLLLADGIGHGPEAAAAARTAVRTFADSPDEAPADNVRRLHDALRPTRGATLGVAALEPAERQVRYAGVGNISAVVVGGGTVRHLVSHNGTAGHEVRRIQEFVYPWPADGVLIMMSDGLSSRWNLDAYPGLLSHHPAVVAGVFFRDFARRYDDATVVLAAARQGRRAGMERV